MKTNDFKILNKFNIKSAVLSDCPMWLKKWIAEVLKVIRLENRRNNDNNRPNLQTTSRLQNLVITVDKIKSSCDITGLREPYILLNQQNVLQYLWGEDDYSIKSQLKSLFQLTSINCNLLEESALTHNDARYNLLRVKDFLKEVRPNKWIGTGISDILHLIAHTKVFFYEKKYGSFNSLEPSFYNLKNFVMNRNGQEIVYSQKKYSGLYIHGQLSHWFKQNIEDPDVSYRSAKCGILQLCSIKSAKDCNYSNELRNKLLNHIRNKPSSNWQTISKSGMPWNCFKSKAKILGSPMFDAEYENDKKILLKVLDQIDKPVNEQIYRM
jgi:hypothetical protein